MSDIFVSHVNEDSTLALEIADGLEAAGYTTWYYERDILPGSSHLEQTSKAIAEARAVLLLVSRASLASNEVDSEVEWTHTSRKPLVPVLSDLAWEDFEHQQPKWRRIIGSAVGINIPTDGVAAVMPRVVAGLKALTIQPRSPKERAAEVQARERTEQLATMRDQASSLSKAAKWDEAATAWRAYLASEPDDRASAEAELARAEQRAGLAPAYAQAKTAVARKDYDAAIPLLKGILAQDASNVPGLRLLADAIEQQMGKRARPPWRLIGIAAAAVALVAALVVVLPRLLPTLAPARPTVTVTVEAAETNTPAGATKEGSSRSAPSPVSAAQEAAQTRTQQPTQRPTAIVTATVRPPELTSAAPVKQATAPRVASPAATDLSTDQYITVPDKLASEFFAPGPSPAALAVADDTVWLVDSTQYRIYKMDRKGSILSSFPISVTYGDFSLEWDGQALLLTSTPPDVPNRNTSIVRLDTSGHVLGSSQRPDRWDVFRAQNPNDGTIWEYREHLEYLVQYSADNTLLQTYAADIVDSISDMELKTISFFASADGLWVTTRAGDWYRVGLDGRIGASSSSVSERLPGPKIVLDNGGSLWVVGSGRKVYQYSTRQERIAPTATRAPTQASQAGEQILPHPQFRQGTSPDKVIVNITNELQGQMILEINGRSESGRSTVVESGETWTEELSETSYTIFASANVPTPIAFSGNELLLSGYEYTWVLTRPK